ncbi:hypothetical protein IKO50_01485 [bacterium]|nr:hypothetical protein [bacterium]
MVGVVVVLPFSVDVFLLLSAFVVEFHLDTFVDELRHHPPQEYHCDFGSSFFVVLFCELLFHPLFQELLPVQVIQLPNATWSPTPICQSQLTSHFSFHGTIVV